MNCIIMDIKWDRKFETLVYAGLWLLVIGLCLIDVIQARSMAGLPLLDGKTVSGIVCVLIPFAVMFLINNMLLIPRLLFRNRYGAYFIAIMIVLVATCIVQYELFFAGFTHNAVVHAGMPRSGPRPLFPLPVFLDFVYALLLIGSNLAVALIFQRYDDRLEKESLLKANAENQLAYLKVQINPHFYMNMLNNIHGMIEIDAGKAQEMLLEMSQLMRYMLYESSRPYISLANEVHFLKSYLSLMRRRYPENRVAISGEFPDESAVSHVKIPPLLFLVFIENAFKHGINYNMKSFVDVRLRLVDGKVCFSCINSNNSDVSAKCDGIGLRNVGQRLALIYGNDFSIDVESDNRFYKVELTVPPYDTKGIDN